MPKNRVRRGVATPAVERIHRREVSKPANRIPLVSVIIPMYNSAKFISQTLESLLYQTLENFEVVVVDDCSTDNSVEVVESYAERFGGGLHVVKLRENTGTPGLPRNVGIQYARGKYIAFLDSDDLFTKTALEELTTLAERFQADVVRTNSWFVLWNNKKKSVDDPAFTNFTELTDPANRMIKSEHNPKLLTEPTLEPFDIAERVKSFTTWETFWTSWLSFYRRDFLIKNQILFPPMLKSEDAPFVLKCFLLAKNFLRVPNATYVNRPRAASVSRIENSANNMPTNIPNYMHKNICSLSKGFNELERVMNSFQFFREHLDYRYAVLNFFGEKSFYWFGPMQNIYAQIPPFALNDLIKREFHPDDAALTAYLFNTLNVYRLQLMRLQQEIYKFKQEGSHGQR